MIRYFVILALAVFTNGIAANPAYAQLAANPSAIPVQAPPKQTIDPAQIKALTDTLNDPTAREKLIQQLNLLAQQQAAQQPEESEPIGSRVLKFLSAKVSDLGQQFGALGDAFLGLPAAERWIERQLSIPEKRARWSALATSLPMVLAAGAISFALAYLAIRGPRRLLERRRAAGIVLKIVFGALRLLLRTFPIGLFGIVSYALLSVIAPPVRVSLATLAIINACLLVMTVTAASRFLLAPRVPNLRLVSVGDKNAIFMHRWICRIGAIVAFGWFGIAALRLLGLPRIAANGALKLVGFSVLIILVGLAIGRRRAVARWIRGPRDPGDPVHFWVSAYWSVRQWLSEVWHLLVVAYLVATFAIWAFDLEGGFEFIVRTTVVSVLIAGGAHLIVRIAGQAVDRAMTAPPDPTGHLPRLQLRANRYLPIIRSTVSVLVWLLAIIALAEVWGVDSLDLFAGSDGHALLGRIVSIAFVVISAVIVWEFVSVIIEAYLTGAVRDGTTVERSQRVRTLLPLLRNAFLIFLIVVVLLLVLSELGLNIAPLLAGAGVVGLAIGFGAQTLVKDVITGIFILFENTIAVGDVVDLGGGHAGLVEHFSVRTVRLRDVSGGLHTVPFSNVTWVNNMTKDFAFYVFNVKVAYAQDTDRVVDILTTLGAELQKEKTYKDMILSPLEIFGVDSFGADAAIVQARFKTKPSKQWAVGREFNRRLKMRFDELDIPMSFPQRMVVLPSGNTIEPAGGAAASTAQPGAD